MKAAMTLTQFIREIFVKGYRIIYGIEEKILASRVVVTNTADSGPGSLREAIEQANTNSGPDSIVFQIPISDPNYDSETGVWTIKPLTVLLSSITRRTTKRSS